VELGKSLYLLLSRLKGFPCSLPIVGPTAAPGVQAVSPQVNLPLGSRLPLLSARPAVTVPATENHHPLVGTRLYCLVTEAHKCEQLAQCCYAAFAGVGFEPTTRLLKEKKTVIYIYCGSFSSNGICLLFFIFMISISVK